VRRVMDTERVGIGVSGSSARMLSREVHTSLRGRGMATVIRPFGFREYLRHRDEEPTKEARRWTAAERSLVEKRFREFLVEGGFPEAQGLQPSLRMELLQGYVAGPTSTGQRFSASPVMGTKRTGNTRSSVNPSA